MVNSRYVTCLFLPPSPFPSLSLPSLPLPSPSTLYLSLPSPPSPLPSLSPPPLPPRHRCLNMFLEAYCEHWLQTSEHSTHDKLTEELLDKQDYLVSMQEVEMRRMPEQDQRRMGQRSKPDPLMQLLRKFNRLATSREM